MELKVEDWEEWFSMPQAKEFLSKMDEMRTNRLESIAINIFNDNIHQASIESGTILCLMEINNLILTLKGGK